MIETDWKMEQTTHGQRWHKNNAQSMQLMSFPTTSAVNWLWLEIFSIAVSFVHSFLWRAFFCPFLFGFCWLLYCVFYNFYSFCSCSRMVVCCVEMQFVFFARCLPVSTLVLHCGHFFFVCHAAHSKCTAWNGALMATKKTEALEWNTNIPTWKPSETKTNFMLKWHDSKL